jgi:hypothetical protein
VPLEFFSIEGLGHGFMGFYLPVNKSLPEIAEIVKMIEEILLDNTTAKVEEVNESFRHSVLEDKSILDESTYLEKTKLLE